MFNLPFSGGASFGSSLLSPASDISGTTSASTDWTSSLFDNFLSEKKYSFNLTRLGQKNLMIPLFIDL